MNELLEIIILQEIYATFIYTDVKHYLSVTILNKEGTLLWSKSFYANITESLWGHVGTKSSNYV